MKNVIAVRMAARPGTEKSAEHVQNTESRKSGRRRRVKSRTLTIVI